MYIYIYVYIYIHIYIYTYICVCVCVGMHVCIYMYTMYTMYITCPCSLTGLEFFCTTIETPEGDVSLLQTAMTAMNAAPDPDNSEERKGCSGRVGKMIFSAGVQQLAIVAYVRFLYMYVYYVCPIDKNICACTHIYIICIVIHVYIYI